MVDYEWNAIYKYTLLVLHDTAVLESYRNTLLLKQFIRHAGHVSSVFFLNKL